jgi:hypothetical protein
MTGAGLAAHSHIADRVVGGLALRRRRVIDGVVDQARAIDGYSALDADELADLADHLSKGLDAVIAGIAERRQLELEDVAFVWPHIHRRTVAGIPEGDMLAVVRVFQRTLWDTIVELTGAEQEAAVTLARPLLGYIDVLSDAVNRAYLEAGGVGGPGRGRAELLAALLSGAPLLPGTTLATARSAGLDPAGRFVVIVGRPAGTAPDLELRIAATLVARSAGLGVEPLSDARDGELVIVLPASEDDLGSLVDRVREGQHRLLARGLRLALGASTLHDGLAAAPAAYAEACLALGQVRDAAGMLALSTLDVHEYLILRAGDRTAWRLIPAAVRAFVAADAEQSGMLSTTMLAYASADLSVKLAAAALYVHPNTVHYRLAKIESLTGLDVRRLRDAQLLVTAIRLHGREVG